MRLALAFLAPVACADRRVPESPEPAFAAKNLVMITVDTLRRDHVSRYDPLQRDLTPFLASLLDEGVVADDHRACSNWTFHATACALSGRTELELGQLPELDLPNTVPWSHEIAFLPDHLEAAGFETLFVGGNGWLYPQFGLTDGFDRAAVTSARDATGLYADAAAQLAPEIAADPKERWYLHLHWMEPHPPYTPPAEHTQGLEALPPVPWDLDSQPGHYTATDMAWPSLSPQDQALLQAHLELRYQGEVRWFDAQLREVVADLDARGWLDDTLVVIWSDHGEQFWEHGHQTHAWQLFPEETGAVFVAWARGLDPAVVSRPTRPTDLLPTTLDLLGLDAPDDLDGRSILDLDLDRPRFAATRARLGPIQSVEHHGRLLTYAWEGIATFHDLTVDPGAALDTFDAPDPEVQALWTLLAPKVRAAAALVPDQTPVEVEGLPL